MQTYIDASQVSFQYDELAEQLVLQEVTLSVPRGQHVALLGRNGSGKSTFARLTNALEPLQSGELYVFGHSVCDPEALWLIRQSCGMVFQNPDNQLVASTVEEDVAFGPENLGLESTEIRARVDEALAYVGLSDYAKKMPSELSGGQKQKLAIAGILAMKPLGIVLDESTSMLDPQSRESFMRLIERLRQENGITVLNITHDMSEALMADRIYVLDQGRLVLQGSPEEVFAQVELLRNLALDVPAHTALIHSLQAYFKTEVDLKRAVREEEARTLLLELAERGLKMAVSEATTSVVDESSSLNRGLVAKAQQLAYRYEGTGVSSPAIEGINFEFYSGEIIGLMGHSGSGKSTLVQHLNGLLPLQEGELEVLGYSLSNRKELRSLRRQVGLLFQYPEHQLFAATVYEDIAYGPKQLGIPEEEIDERVRQALVQVGLTEELLDKSPFELSGGQKRRVAIAGILVMRPTLLVLDEPAAGLDPAGREDVLRDVLRLKEEGTTVVLVSHSMEDLARVSDRILVLSHGQQLAFDTPENLFGQARLLEDHGLKRPALQQFLESLKPSWPKLNTACYSIESARQAVLACLGGVSCD